MIRKTEASGKDSPKKEVSNFRNKCLCCNKRVLPRNHPVEIFGEKSNKQPEFFKALEFLIGKQMQR